MNKIRTASLHFDDVQLLETSKSASTVTIARSPKTMDIFSMNCQTEFRSLVAWIAVSYSNYRYIYYFSAEIQALSSENRAKVSKLIPTIFIQRVTFLLR